MHLKKRIFVFIREHGKMFNRQKYTKHCYSLKEPADAKMSDSFKNTNKPSRTTTTTTTATTKAETATTKTNFKP
jgi:hypothetical protein